MGERAQPTDDAGRRTLRFIASALRQRRADLGMTQEDLADAIGVDRQYIVGLESGRSVQQLDRLIAALNGLGLELVVVPRAHPLAQRMLVETPTAPRRVDRS